MTIEDEYAAHVEAICKFVSVYIDGKTHAEGYVFALAMTEVAKSVEEMTKKHVEIVNVNSRGGSDAVS
jgi:hypothetical protein